MTMTSPAIVIITFKLRSPAHRDDFIALSRELVDWLHRRTGFVRYELYEGVDGTWSDTMVWQDSEAADAGNAAFERTSLRQKFAAIVEPGYRAFQGRSVKLQAAERTI